MKDLSVKWQKLIVWLTGWLGIIPFVIAGGYIHQKSEDQGVRRSAKCALIVVAVFTALEILNLLFTCIFALSDASFDVRNVFTKIFVAVELIRIICFVTLFILDMCGVCFDKDASNQ